MFYSLLYALATTLPTIVQCQDNITGEFELAGRSGVPPMHAALLPDGNVIFLDKVENYTEMWIKQKNFYSSIYEPNPRVGYRLTPVQVLSNAFCCGGTYLADGTLMTVGGNGPLPWLDSSVGDGFAALRYFRAGEKEKGWQEYENNKMSSRRWYPSAQTLSDGRVFIAAGSLNAMNIRNKSNNNPTYELLDGKGKPEGKNIPLDILERTKSSQIFNVEKDEVVKQMPDLPGMYRTYPSTGGSVMLPLLEKNKYRVEIMICGGGESDDDKSLTDDSCGIIKPLDGKPDWEMTKMPGGGRVMVEGIPLLDGTILWLNGARRGCQGFGTASDPAFEALIYNPITGKWAVAGESSIPRLYHSVAFMLLDGRILVAGSNPNEMPLLPKDVDPEINAKAYPTEFRIEWYTPSYLLGANTLKRPRNIEIMEEIFVPGKTISPINFHSADLPKDVTVWLYQSGFVTHSVHMGQTMIEMEQIKPVKHHRHGRYEATVRVPGIKLAPGPYVMYLVVNGVPGHGQFISVQTQ